MTRYVPALVVAAFALSGTAFSAEHKQNGKVTLVRVPNDGLQPQVAAGRDGTIHLIYFKGEARQGDIFYVRSKDGGASFSEPVRVNSQEGSAVAAGTIRGAQIALGRGGRIHVAWNGSGIAQPKGPLNPEQPKDSPHNGLPMLYTRSNDANTAFEPQRNLMQSTFALDGGGSVAADSSGNVYVAWHGSKEGAVKGEAGRRVWVVRSQDDGKTFSAETAANQEPTGACGCCGMRVFADSKGGVYALYRTATESVHRDIYLLASHDRGKNFQGSLVHKWDINACPMSSMSFAEGPAGVLGAWETQGQVYFAAVDSGKTSPPVAAPGAAERRKHPALAVNSRGETLLVWTEGTGWQKGGALAWQVFDKNGQPTVDSGRIPSIPAWSFGAAFARPDGGFSIVY